MDEIGPSVGRSAVPRSAPYVWVTWLADLMAGAACQWRYWFQVHYQLREKAVTFDDPAWHLRHSKLLTQLERALREKGLEPEIESAFTEPLDKEGAQLSGRMDCLVDDDSLQTGTVYDCKTGAPKPRDKIQVLLYMRDLTRRKRFRDKGIRGRVVYEDHEDRIDSFPEGFNEDVSFWLDLLLAERPPRKVPGGDCRFCPVTKQDCPERIEEIAS